MMPHVGVYSLEKASLAASRRFYFNPKGLIWCLSFLLLGNTPAGAASWQKVQNISAAGVTSMAVDAAGTVFITTAGGIYRSSNFAGTWVSATGNLPANAYGAVAADPNRAGVVFVWTNVGLFKTVNGGGSWQGPLPFSLPSGVTIASVNVSNIVIAPTNSNHIYVSTFGAYVQCSTDGGATWSLCSNGLTAGPGGPAYTSGVAVDPTNDNIAYTTTWRGLFFKTTNGGLSWTSIGGSATWGNGQAYIASGNPSVLYVINDEFSFGRGTVLRSSDGGDTWTDAGRPDGVASDASQLAVDATGNTVYATTTKGLYVSLTGGGTWTPVFAPSPPPTQLGPILWDPTNASRIYTGSPYNGLFRSTDGGATWTNQSTGLAGATVTGLALCNNNGLNAYAGVAGVGLLKSIDGGATWSSLTTPFQPAISGLACDPTNSQTLLLGASSDGQGTVWRTSDGGKTFSVAASGYSPGYISFNPWVPKYVNASIADYLGGALFSNDAGMTWSVPAFWYAYAQNYVYHPSANIVFTVADEYTGAPRDTVLFAWDNSGTANFSNTISFGQGNFNSLALDENQPTLAYVAGTITTEGTQGIYEFQINYQGSSVSSVTRVGPAGTTFNGTGATALGSTDVRQLTYNQATGYLYAATGNGIFRSSDQGISWHSINAPSPSINQIALDASGLKLFAGMNDGIWEYTEAAASVSPSFLTFTNQPIVSTTPPPFAQVEYFSLYNAGTAPLSQMSLSFTPGATTGQTEFGVAENACPSSLAPGGSCTIGIGFSPTSTGSKTATFTISSNALTGAVNIVVKGNAIPPAPVANVSPASLSFANPLPGTPDSSQAVTVSNPSGSSGSISILSITPSSPFMLDPKFNSCAPIAEGTNCTIRVSFTPTAAIPIGPVSGNLTIVDSNNNSYTVSLSGLYFPDSDRDGIPDPWETSGVCVVPPSNSSNMPTYVTGPITNCPVNSTFLDLPDMGAVVGTPDIFVQIDWMGTSPDGSHDHVPKPQAIQDVINTFKNHGINLHVDCGNCGVVDPVLGRQWLPNLSEAQVLPHQDVLGSAANSPFTAPGLGLKMERLGVFRYFIFAHDLFQSESSGVAIGDQSIVSLGSWTGQVGTQAEQEGTIMHELGHVLGLRHGGFEDTNNKPNYLSVMNYHFQTRGLIFSSDSSSPNVLPQDGLFDYSGMVLGSLDEAALTNTAVPGLPGLADPYGTLTDFYHTLYYGHFGTRYYCINSTNQSLLDEAVADAFANPINWDCGLGGVPYIDGTNTGKPVVLAGFDDWRNLNFTAGAVGQFGTASPPPLPVQEITTTQNATIKTFYGVSVQGTGNAGLALGASTILTFTILNKGSVTDTYALVGASTQTWADFSGVPPQVTLPSGASAVFNVAVQVPTAGVAGTVNTITLQALSQGNPRLSDIARSDITAGQADLQIAMSTGTVLLPGNITYQITIANNGPDPASNIVLDSIISGGGAFVSVTPASTVCLGTQNVSCALGTLASGSTAQITLLVAPAAAGTITNTATVRSSVFDPIPSNNSATVSATVVGRPSLFASITSQAVTGNTLTLSLQLANTGTGPAQNVNVSQIRFRVLTGSGSVTLVQPNLPLALGSVDVGESQTISLLVNVPASVTRFAITETGTLKDSIGDNYSFSLSQAVIP